MSADTRRPPGEEPPRPTVAARPSRPDASMTLLTEVMHHPLDPSYEAAGERRRLSGQAMPAGRGTRTLITVLAAVMVGLVLAAAGAQLRAPQPGAARARVDLIARIQQRTSETDALARQNSRLRAQIARGQAALAGGSGTVSARTVQRLGVLTGAVAVRGPGVQIVVDDAAGLGDTSGQNADPRDDTAVKGGRVLDLDLQVVVNGLWAAGAEAVAVNGQRLTALSAIRQAGTAILVDFRPLTPPYRIEAIGNPRGLRAGFAAGAAGRYLRGIVDNDGIRAQVSERDVLSLRSAGSLQLRYAILAQAPRPTPTRTPTRSTSSRPPNTLRSSP